MSRRGPIRNHIMRGPVGTSAWGSGGGSTPFNPSQIASCVTWHRADLGITLNAGNVSAWADQAGSADGVQNTANRQPLYDADDADMLNAASIKYDGSNDAIAFGTGSSFNHIHNGTGGAFWMVFRSGATLADAQIMHNMTLYSNPGFYMYQNSSGTIEIRIGTVGAAVFTNSAATVVAGTNYQLLVQYTSPNWAVRLNAAATASGTEVAAPSANDAANALYIGDVAGGGQGWNGRIHEFATFTSTLSGTDLSRLEAYGAAKL